MGSWLLITPVGPRRRESWLSWLIMSPPFHLSRSHAASSGQGVQREETKTATEESPQTNENNFKVPPQELDRQGVRDPDGLHLIMVISAYTMPTASRTNLQAERDREESLVVMWVYCLWKV